MKFSFQEAFSKQLPVFDIAIIGAGAAGLELIDALKDVEGSFILIERGVASFQLEDQLKFSFHSIGKKIRQGPCSTFEDVKKKRCRFSGFGGTLNIWERVFKVLSPYDFVKWPISYEELLPYYKMSAEHHGILRIFEEEKINTGFPLKHSSFIKMGKDQETPLIEQLHALEKRQNTLLLLGGAAVRFEMSENQQKILSLIVQDAKGNKKAIKAHHYVLAAGTIETTRLLLAHRERFLSTSSLLGKYLMDHPKGYCGTLIPSQKASTFFEKDRLYKRIGWVLDPYFLKEEGLPNHCLTLKKAFRKGEPSFLMRFHLEQLPREESQITLSRELDAFSLPIPFVNWQLSPQDEVLFRKFFFKMKMSLEENSMGFVIYDEKELSLDPFLDASHQMGTTRMGIDQEKGVVNPHLQFFGLDNLFLLSNAVFPSSGSANPTFTLLALARRLGDHLKKRIQSIAKI